MDAAVACQGLVKEFASGSGRVRAVDGIDIEVPRGALFGFLGPNGAGKTTLMRMLHAAVVPTAGNAHVLGYDVATQARPLKARLGVVPQENNLDPDFTVEKNLLVYARYFGIRGQEARRKAAELLRFVGLDERKDAEVEELSGGMKRRLILARSLINDPQLLILDEPTTGLDPQSRHVVWDKVRELKRQGITILLTTHYMDEAERLCDEIVVVDHGRILERGAPRQLIARHAGRDVLELAFDDEPRAHEADLRSLPGVGNARIDFLSDRALMFVENADAARQAAHERLHPRESLVRRATLKDVFLRLTGRGLRE